MLSEIRRGYQASAQPFREVPKPDLSYPTLKLHITLSTGLHGVDGIWQSLHPGSFCLKTQQGPEGLSTTGIQNHRSPLPLTPTLIPSEFLLVILSYVFTS